MFKLFVALVFALVWYLAVKYCLEEIDDGYETLDTDR